MNNAIYLRPLTVDDAKVSYLWRADEELWKYTHFKANKLITEAIETEWLQNKLQKENDSRFAICLNNPDQYVGNAQLIDIENDRAELYVFIGDKSKWNNGIGFNATKLVLQHGFCALKINSVFLFVHHGNTAAVSIFKKCGFATVSETDGFMEMELTKHEFKP